MPSSSHPRRHKVAALVYDELCTFEFAITQEVLNLTPPDGETRLYDFQTFSTSGEPIRAHCGLSILPDHGAGLLKTADTIIVPGWPVNAAPCSPKLARAMKAAARRGARMISICTGAFLLAELGLLEGRRATTHWLHAEKFRSRFPDVEFEPAALYVDEADVLTSAGAAAGIDLLLHIVRQDFGAAKANAVARRLVLPAHREGGQQQFIDTPMPRPRDAGLSSLIDDIRAAPGLDWSLEQLAGTAGMSERTFSRRFSEATGTSPGKWLQSERIRAARLMLEESDAPLAEIAAHTGFGSFENFARRFRARVGVNPAAYRRTFRQKSVT
ncbi:helix-turn-helix domain-containing protein [Parvularcula marina]|uniref:helix-turn-helix domain-containing protein n=1 Tax=Parvularcula marina TaxID=2292771 RepID=UPI003513E46F